MEKNHILNHSLNHSAYLIPQEPKLSLWNNIWADPLVKASVHGASNKLGDWMTVYMIFLHGLAQQWRLTKNDIWHKGSLRHEDDAQTLNTWKITVTALCHNCAHSYAHSTDNSYTWTSELSFCLWFVCLSLSFLHIFSRLLSAWLSKPVQFLTTWRD